MSNRDRELLCSSGRLHSASSVMHLSKSDLMCVRSDGGFQMGDPPDDHGDKSMMMMMMIYK